MSPDESTGPDAAHGPAAEALLYPRAPRLCVESHLTYYTTPTSLTWVLETMLPPERRLQIAQEIATTYEMYHVEILQAVKPVVIGGFLDAMQVVEEDLAEAVAQRREALERLASRYQDDVVDQELVPLIREQIWPIVRKHAEPLAKLRHARAAARSKTGSSGRENSTSGRPSGAATSMSTYGVQLERPRFV